MKTRTIILQGLLMCSLLAPVKNVSAGGVGTTGAQILEIMPDAKTAAMGDTYSGLDGEMGCLYYNPAGLAGVKNVELTCSNNQWQGMSHQYMGMAYSLHDIRAANVVDMGTLAVAFSDLNSGQINGMDVNGIPTGTFSARDQLLIASYAKTLYEERSFGELAAGTSAKFITEQIGSSNANAAACDIGVLWKMPFYNACLGLTRQNMGGDIQDDSEAFALPSNTKLSASAKAFYGALTMNIDLNKPDVSQQTYNLGTEYNYKDTIYLRLGYNNKYSDTSGLTTGIGMSLKQLDVLFLYASEVRIDYAFIPDLELGNVNKISITMKLGAD